MLFHSNRYSDIADFFFLDNWNEVSYEVFRKVSIEILF